MKKRVDQILQFKVTIPLWFILTVAAGVVIAAYFIAPGHREDIKFITILIGGMAGIYSAYYVGAGLRLNVERQKQQASFEILSLLNRPEFVEVRHFIEKEVEGHESLSAADLYQKIVSNPKLDNAVATVMGILEDAAIAIQHDFVCENILHCSLCAIVQRNFRGLRGYIELVRKNVSPTYYVEVQRLYGAWEAGRRLSDGRELPKIFLS
jgi:hypothetical protein